MDGAETASLAKIVMDCDVVGHDSAPRARRSRSTRRAALVDDIAEVGIGGHFLSRRSTRRFLQAGGAVAAEGCSSATRSSSYAGRAVSRRRRPRRRGTLLASHEVAPLSRRRRARDRRRHRTLRAAWELRPGGSAGGRRDQHGHGVSRGHRPDDAGTPDPESRSREDAWHDRGSSTCPTPTRPSSTNRRCASSPRSAWPTTHRPSPAPGRGGRRRRRRGAQGEAAVGADRTLPRLRCRRTSCWRAATRPTTVASAPTACSTRATAPPRTCWTT